MSPQEYIPLEKKVLLMSVNKWKKGNVRIRKQSFLITFTIILLGKNYH